ncbi:MAG: UDP-forming cellulose synthase catalytic subunit [Synechococcales bacterium]|nr:UDP-forming cellulose synthase catalytic subunit [Synechococcales bacterium]
MTSITPPQSRPSSRRQSWLTRGLLSIPTMCDRLLAKAGRWPLFWLVVVLLTLSVPFIITPLAVWQQGAMATFLIAVGWLVVRLEQGQSQRRASEYLHLFLAWLSIVTTLRYLYYRTSYTLNLDTGINAFFSLVLYGAELYAILTLLLSYFQTLKLRDRTPVDLAVIPADQWPTVDVYIPTYNEDINIVRKTALAALALDYPDAKKRIYVLDDGRKFPERRIKLRQMCQELGCTLLTRDNNDHAKAGNINTAMRRTQGELILILDCDHIPSKRFLHETVGFFANPKVALVQTPHWFYNPDPFERNLLTQGRVPVNNELFYKVIQKGNDFWNAAFFCGSAAVIRKDAVMEVGGIAVETVTEDCHTSLRLHSLGYESVYYDKIMVAGLAPEKFSSYVGQQVRWARGMAQILRLENPLFNRKLKLSLPQRLCYLSATSHFFFGFPRIMYALAPVLYLLFGLNLIRGLGIETLAYALPHIVLAMNANYITQKTVRFSFWNEIFEYAMAFQDGIVTFMAILNPKLGKFNVTDKGASVTKRSFDWDSARASLVMLVLLLLSLVAVPFWIYLRPDSLEAVVINALWSVFNLILIVAALLVAMEQPQMRRAHRLNRSLQTILYASNQENLTGQTLDVSETGARILLDSWPNLPDVIEMELVGDFGARAFLDARILRVEPLDDQQVMVSVEFINMTPVQYDGLVLVLYSDVDEWYSQQRTQADRPFASLQFFITSLVRVFREFQPASPTAVRKRVQAKIRLYWNGQFYSGVATEINSRMLRVELESSDIQNLAVLRQMKPPVGVLVTSGDEADRPIRLVAQVTSLDTALPPETDGVSYRMPGQAQCFSVDLVFPKHLDRRQGRKIRALLKDL